MSNGPLNSAEQRKQQFVREMGYLLEQGAYTQEQYNYLVKNYKGEKPLNRLVPPMDQIGVNEPIDWSSVPGKMVDAGKASIEGLYGLQEAVQPYLPERGTIDPRAMLAKLAGYDMGADESIDKWGELYPKKMKQFQASPSIELFEELFNNPSVARQQPYGGPSLQSNIQGGRVATEAMDALIDQNELQTILSELINR